MSTANVNLSMNIPPVQFVDRPLLIEQAPFRQSPGMRLSQFSCHWQQPLWHSRLAQSLVLIQSLEHGCAALPVFCFMDCIAFLIQLFIIRPDNLIGTRAKHSSRLLGAGRIVIRMCSANASDGESIEAFWRNSFAHWLFFAVGGYPSLAKVPSAHGMPWTKTLGCLYILSYVFFEVAICGICLFSGSDESLPSQDHDCRLTGIWLNATLQWPLKLAVILHLSLLVGSLFGLTGFQIGFFSYADNGNPWRKVSCAMGILNWILIVMIMIEDWEDGSMLQWLAWLLVLPVTLGLLFSTLLVTWFLFEAEDSDGFDLLCISFVRIVFIGSVLVYYYRASWASLLLAWAWRAADDYHERCSRYVSRK